MPPRHVRIDRKYADPDWLFGRRFALGDTSIEFSIVAADPQAGTCTAHATDGHAQQMTLQGVAVGIYAGVFVEVARPAFALAPNQVRVRSRVTQRGM